MDKSEFDQLQDPEEWDFKRAEIVAPGRKPRAVVSVALGRDDFERLAAAARQAGMKTSEFIRAAALERIQTRRGGTVFLDATADLGSIVFSGGIEPSPSTRVQIAVNSEETLPPVATATH